VPPVSDLAVPDPSVSGPPVTPVPVPPGVGEVLFFGGTFDPVHRGHVRLPVAARDAALGDGGWLVYVPASRSPHKSRGPAATDADRAEMLRLALLGVERVAVWTDEVDRARGRGEAGGKPPPSFTVETLERAKGALGPGVRLRLLLGTDQAAAFHRWHRAHELLVIAPPVVMLREPIGTPDDLRRTMGATGAWSREELGRWADAAVDVPPLDVSSTAVRDALRHRRGDRGGLTRLLDPRVLDYIEGRGLYAPE